MKPIAIFYHCVFAIGDPPAVLPSARTIVSEQMSELKSSGLAEQAAEIFIAINGNESDSGWELTPIGSIITYHGFESRSENLTVMQLWEWAKTHPDWNVLYFHSKGATHPPGSEHQEKVSRPWRLGMMRDLVTNWRQCVNDLDYHDIVCSHWLWGQCDGTQHIPEGNFLWTTSNFVARLPSMYERQRIKDSGIGALESRYESEVFWGNGPRPKVKQYRLRSYTGAQSRL